MAKYNLKNNMYNYSQMQIVLFLFINLYLSVCANPTNEKIIFYVFYYSPAFLCNKKRGRNFI